MATVLKLPVCFTFHYNVIRPPTRNRLDARSFVPFILLVTVKVVSCLLWQDKDGIADDLFFVRNDRNTKI